MHSTWQAGLATAAVVLLAAVLLRRRPLMALALLLAGSLALAGASASSRRWHAPPAPFTPLLLVLLVVLAGLAVCFIAATRPRQVSVTAAIVTIGVQAACQAEGLAGTARREPAFLGTSLELAVALITVIAWLIGHSTRQAHHHSLTLRAQADAQAATAERLRIARDLHDQVAHAIGIIAIQAGMGSRVIGTQPDQARDALTAIEATSRQTLAGLRQTVRTLRQPDSSPQEHPAPPSLAGLGRLAAATRHAGVHVDIQWSGPQRPLPADIDTCAFRIIQEAVTNVVRHAGTSSCQVSIDQRENELSIKVTDAGLGSTAASAGSGYGIAGMRERAALLGGQLTAGARPEGGFRVAARLPVPAAAR
jgi:signal transduction histidine kinase